MALARFMSSPIGRLMRIVFGLVLIAVGISLGSIVGWIIAVVGLVPITAGTFNLCFLGPLFGAPISGRALRD